MVALASPTLPNAAPKAGKHQGDAGDDNAKNTGATDKDVSKQNDAMLQQMRDNAIQQSKTQMAVANMNHESTTASALSNAATNQSKNSKAAADKTEL